MWRIVASIPIWAAFIVLWFPFMLLGHIIIPLFLALGWTRTYYSSRYGQDYIGFWGHPFTYVWSNEGDGIYPPEYKARYPDWSHFKLAWMWCAVRNPVNNWRFVPLLSLNIVPEKIQWFGSFEDRTQSFAKVPLWFFCWQGIYSNFYWQYVSPRNGKLQKFHVGWKVYPKDIDGLTIPYRRSGAGFATLVWKEL